LIGDPVEHSLSPFIMNRAFAAHGLDASYLTLTVTKDRVVDSIRHLQASGFLGANVTYPLKEAVVKLVDRTTRAVEVIQASNTLQFAGGEILADNTDALGTAHALETLGGRSPRGGRVFIFGAGGGGRAAAYGLLSAGVEAVTFGVRDGARTQEPIDRLRRAFPRTRVDWYDIRRLADGHKTAFDQVDIIINATTVGMSGSGATTLVADDSMIRHRHLCFEFVYHPRATPFIKAADRRGAQTLDGLALLVAQAQAGFYWWTGKKFSLPDMYDAVAVQLASDRPD
jgi:shikimate dehydrogenase